MSDHDLHGAPETAHSNMTLSIIGALGTMLLFALIVYIAYIVPSKRQEAATANLAAQRTATLNEVRSAAAQDANSYGVINAEEGTVRIPIERAMELVVPRLNDDQSSQ